MREGKLFLIEKGHIVVIRESVGQEVSFSTLEEFMKYIPEIDVSRCSDYYYLDYEPEQKIHFYNLQTDKPDAGLKKGSVPDKIFDNLIDNFSLIRQRKDDPFWGISLNKAKDLCLLQMQNKTLNSIRKLSSELNNWKMEVGLIDKQERNNKIKNLLLKDDDIEQQIKSAKSIDEIKSIDHTRYSKAIE